MPRGKRSNGAQSGANTASGQRGQRYICTRTKCDFGGREGADQARHNLTCLYLRAMSESTPQYQGWCKDCVHEGFTQKAHYKTHWRAKHAGNGGKIFGCKGCPAKWADRTPQMRHVKKNECGNLAELCGDRPLEEVLCSAALRKKLLCYGHETLCNVPDWSTTPPAQAPAQQGSGSQQPTQSSLAVNAQGMAGVYSAPTPAQQPPQPQPQPAAQISPAWMSMEGVYATPDRSPDRSQMLPAANPEGLVEPKDFDWSLDDFLQNADGDWVPGFCEWL